MPGVEAGLNQADPQSAEPFCAKRNLGLLAAGQRDGRMIVARPDCKIGDLPLGPNLGRQVGELCRFNDDSKDAQMRLLSVWASKNSVRHHGDPTHAGEISTTTISQCSAARFNSFCQRSPAFNPRSGSRSRNKLSQPWAIIQSRMAIAWALLALEWLKKMRDMGATVSNLSPAEAEVCELHHLESFDATMPAWTESAASLKCLFENPQPLMCARRREASKHQPLEVRYWNRSKYIGERLPSFGGTNVSRLLFGLRLDL
jgi:hypothetical protein